MSQKSLAIRKTLRWLFLALIALSAVEYMFGSVGRLRNMLGETTHPSREMLSWPKRTLPKSQYYGSQQRHTDKDESQNEPNLIEPNYKTLNSSDKDNRLCSNNATNISGSDKCKTKSLDLNVTMSLPMSTSIKTMEQIGISNFSTFKGSDDALVGFLQNVSNSSKNFSLELEPLQMDIDESLKSDKNILNDLYHSSIINNNDLQRYKLLKLQNIQRNGAVNGLKSCPEVPPNLVGEIQPELQYVSVESLDNKYPDVRLGGWYRPKDCKSRYKVAIIVPFRNREPHLGIFLNNLHPFLIKQQLEYGIFIIEQDEDELEFNRGLLFNIGFAEAQNVKKSTNRGKGWDCFIFHDVDLIPLDDRNIYKCPKQPRHMSAGIDKFDFKLSYQTLFGGVSALTTQQFTKVNGFSNKFWGWGGEDDEMSARLRYHGYHIARYPMTIARYTMLQHKKEKANPKRYEIMVKNRNKSSLDGLNTLHYSIKEKKFNALYTWYLVRLSKPS